LPRSKKSEESEEKLPELDEAGREPDLDAEDEDGPLAEEDEDEEEEIGLDVPATAAGKASALRLMELLVEKKALQLHVKKPGAPLVEAVARIVESPLPLKVRATKLSDTLVDSDDVDEFFLNDETLTELLKRW